MDYPMLKQQSVMCPYCGHQYDTFIDTSVEEQEYYEDCQACCSPIMFSVLCSYDGDLLDLYCRTDSE